LPELFIRVFRFTSPDGRAGYQYWCESHADEDNWTNHAETVDQLVKSVLSKVDQVRSAGFQGTLRLHFDPPASLMEKIADRTDKPLARRCFRLAQTEEERFFQLYLSDLSCR
jgi:hypothetical protein